MDDDRTRIHLDDDIDRWQWRCPRGHTSWEPTNGHWWCAECARSWEDDVDPVFHELENTKTGQTVERDEVVLMTPVGPMKEPDSQTQSQSQEKPPA